LQEDFAKTPVALAFRSLMSNHAKPTQFVALQPILAEQIQSGLNLQSSGFQASDLQAGRASHSSVDIPLKRVKSGISLKYVSAIAFRLASDPASVPRIAQQIVENLHRTIPSDQSSPLAQLVAQNLQISVAAPGWIDLELSRAGLAGWFYEQLNAPVASVSELSLNLLAADRMHQSWLQPNMSSSAEVLAVLHSHARCHSILNAADLAHDWRLSLTQSARFSAAWRANIWHPAEWHLIEQLVDLIDYLSSDCLGSDCLIPDCLTQSKSVSLRVRLKKLADDLSQKFQLFYAACPPNGAAVQNQAVADRQLGLVLLTQRLLLLLLGLLGLPAPEQL
jgi:hypothetical protein